VAAICRHSSDEAIDVIVDRGARLTSPMSAIHLHQMGGAVGRVGIADTAFSGRAAAYTYNLVSTWTDPAEDAQHIAQNRELAVAIAPYSHDTTYVNFLADSPENNGESESVVRAAYGEDLYVRLARLKREFDPYNLFRVNQNVRPAR
jgi:hypothetical protein